jgi:hypothetical protein
MRPGDIIDDRWQVLNQMSYQGKEGCQDPRCTRSSIGPDGIGECRGYHCHLCDAPTSMYGHCVTGRYVDGNFRKFADGESAYSCQPGFEDIPLASVEA